MSSAISLPAMPSLRLLPLLIVALYSPVHAASPEAIYKNAVEAARRGDYVPALRTLENLTARYPARHAYRNDLVVIYSWADQHSAALKAAQPLRLNSDTPDYVLRAIARSALLAGSPLKSLEAASELLHRHPEDKDAQLWLLVAQQNRSSPSDSGALVNLKQWFAQNPTAVASARELLNEESRQALASLFVPKNATTSPNELADAQDRNGGAIRAGEKLLDEDFTPARYQLIDAALADNAKLISRARAEHATEVLRQLRYDRIVALRDRGLAETALQEYRVLEQEEAVLPAYVIIAAADASLRLRQPGQARELYQKAIDAGAAGALNGRYYAELEQEDFAAFEHTSDEIARGSSPRDAHLTTARTQRFADRLAAAETTLREALESAPEDRALHHALGATLAARGLPRAAGAEYELATGEAERNIHLRVDKIDSQLARGDLGNALPALAALAAEAPEHPAVQRLVASRAAAKRPLLTTNLTRGDGQGRVAGHQDLYWETTLYGGQSDQGIRPYVQHRRASASFDNNEPHHERALVGMNVTRTDTSMSAEVGQDLDNGQDFIWAVRGSWQADDHWNFRGAYENETSDFPLKGRLPGSEADAPRYLHASRTKLGVSRRWNESRQLSLDLNHDDFNDGNQRYAAQLAWTERLQQATRHTLDLVTTAYTSRNSREDAIYFNPRRDWSLGATLSGDWLSWREYERRFNQRFAVTAGLYSEVGSLPEGGQIREHDYGPKPWADLRYEHAWQNGDEWSARYGLGFNRFPYDGRYENKVYVYLDAGWRF